MSLKTRSYGRTLSKKQRKRLDLGMPVRILVVFLGIACILGLAAAGVYGVSKWLCSTPFFTVTGVTIDGCSRVREDTVLKLSGVKPDSNLLGLDLEEMADAVEEHPWIVSAAISKKLPDRLEIVIQERVPVAMVSSEGLYLVDARGTIFKKLVSGEKFDLPVITGLESILPDQPDGTGKRKIQGTADYESIALAREGLGKALEIISLASTGTRTLGVNDISEIHVEGNSMVLYTADKGLPLRFSGVTSLRLQFQRAEKILYHLYSSGKYRKIAMVELDYGSDTALATMKN